MLASRITEIVTDKYRGKHAGNEVVWSPKPFRKRYSRLTNPNFPKDRRGTKGPKSAVCNS